ncbi:MAG TPA: hypothetical protein VNN72_15495 [Polyangiaceae bacterium]|nr:hypothetical protein [Polyangiaceae bacterium]
MPKAVAGRRRAIFAGFPRRAWRRTFRGLEQLLASSLLDLRNGLRNSGFPPVPAAQNRQFRAESGAVRGVARMLLKSLVERQTP